MRAIPRFLVALLCLAELASPFSALADTVRPGTRVRLTGEWKDGRRRTGDFVASARDSIWIRDDRPGDEPLGFRALDVKRLEISRGSLGNSRLWGTIGFVSGFAVGAVLGASLYIESNSAVGGTRGDSALGTGGFFGAVGLLVGAFYGATTSVEKWKAVPVPASNETWSAAADSTK